MARYPNRISTARFAKDERGTVAVVLGLAAIPLVMSVGAALDYSRANAVDTSLQSVVDAAAVKAVAQRTQEERRAHAIQFVRAGVGRLPHGATVRDADIVVAEELTGSLRTPRLTVRATASVPMVMSQMLGVRTFSVAAQADAAVSSKTVEIALVVDVTGSMLGDRIRALRSSATDFVNTLLADNVDTQNIRLSIVPYTASVNIGRARGDWLKSLNDTVGGSRFSNRYIWREVSQAQCTGTNVTWNADLQACHIGALQVWDEKGGPCPGIKDRNVCYVSDGWAGCVEERGRGDDDMTDAPPATKRWRPYYWPSWGGVANASPSNNFNSYLPNAVDETRQTNGFGNGGRGPNLGCPQNTIMNWTNNRAALLQHIAGFEAWHRGGTMGHIGLVWGWRMLSPRWRGLWGSPELPRDYDTSATQKIVVFMTDGENGFFAGLAPSGSSDYTAYGRVDEVPNMTTSAQTFLDQKMLKTCTDMKAHEIEIFTVGLGLSNNAAGTQARNLLRTCATSNTHFFDANTTTLLAHFNKIANEIASRRIRIAR